MSSICVQVVFDTSENLIHTRLQTSWVGATGVTHFDASTVTGFPLIMPNRATSLITSET